MASRLLMTTHLLSDDLFHDLSMSEKFRLGLRDLSQNRFFKSLTQNDIISIDMKILLIFGLHELC